MFSQDYAKRMGDFRVDMQSEDSHTAQENEHRRQSATLAAEAATLGLLAARSIQTEDIDEDTQGMLADIFECE